MNKIKRVSYFFRILFQIIFIFVLVEPIIGWINAPEPIYLRLFTLSVIPPVYHNAIFAPLSDETRALGFLVDLVPLFVELFVLVNLIKLFRLYEKGEIFSLRNVRFIRNAGYALLIDQLIRPLHEFILGFVLTWHNPPGQGLAIISISRTDMGVVLTAFIIILISWVMAEGYKLREEQQLTI